MYDSGSDSTLKSDTRSVTKHQQPPSQLRQKKNEEAVTSPGLKIAVSVSPVI